MIVVVDIETRGLDARKFLTACILKENGKKKHFYNKEDLWKYLIDLGKKELKRKKVLNVYAHNHEFDFYGYADLTDKNLEFFSFRPFIASYYYKKRKAINFLDSFAIFKMSLAKLGEMIDLPKLDLPKEFENAERITKKRLRELESYVERDVEIVMEALKMMKDRIRAEGIQIRRLYTISQIAIGYLINKLKQNKKYDNLFFIKERGIIHRTRHKEKIHGAYRGGRCECFKLGHFDKVDYVDVNNLYGYASTKIKFPDLRTEQFIKEPLKYFGMRQILKNIGVSRVLLNNREDDIGLLPVRTGTGNYYPKKDTYIIGTYTHIELREAIEQGYEIMDIEWSLVWKEAPNPFKEITPKLYQLRKEEKNKFNNFFYKEMQNRSYGKMAQQKTGQEIIIDSVEEAKKYLSKNFEILRGEGYNYMYKRDVQQKDKSYYAPIIPTLINAYARVIMFKAFKKVGKEALIYTDTDSCIMEQGHLDKFEINGELGGYKIEYEGEECIIKGRKTYAIGDEVKVSGFRKRDVTLDNFKQGEIKSMKMKTLKTAKDLKEVGSFYEETRDLNKQEWENERINELYRNEKAFKDEDVSNINYFIEVLNKIG